MTTPATGRKFTSACNGVTKVFNCPLFRDAGDLEVYLLDSAADPNEAGILLAGAGADYVLAGSGPAGTATITTTLTYPNGKYIRRWRRTSRAQGNDYVPNDGFPADSQEGALDRLSLIDEELDDDIGTVDAELQTFETQVNAEIAGFAAADEALQANIDAEAATRSAGDASLLQAILAIQASGGIIPVEVGKLTPENYGGTRYDPADEVDASDALQAFFRAARDENICRHYKFDWSGEWMVTRTIMAAYGPNEPNVERRIIAGSLRVPPLAQLPGGLPLDPVLDVAGAQLQWEGITGVYPTGISHRDLAFRTYAARSFVGAVRLRSIAEATFGDFHAECLQRDVINVVSSNAPFTLDGINFGTSNCIGARIGRVYGVYMGSNWRGGEIAPMVASARVHGGNTGAAYSAEVFAAGSAGFVGSAHQRTKLTVLSTAALQVYDLVWCRLDLDAAIYGTVAMADNGDGTGTITWSAGDPTAINGAGAGLVVGDVYPAFSVAPYIGKEYRIVSFGGANNRIVTVAPAPTPLAATASATYNQQSEKSWHWVASVIDATNFTVFPWVADRINSTFHLNTGYAARFEGPNLANLNLAAAMSLLGGGALYAKGLYSINVGTVLAESTPIGVRLSDPVDNLCVGINVQHGHVGHADGCDVSILSGSSNVYGTINLQSDFSLASCVAPGPRALPNSRRPADGRLGYLQIAGEDGVWHETEFQNVNEGGSWSSIGISNAKPKRQVFIHSDAETLTVSLDRDEARFFPKHHWARIEWTGPAGADPSGALVLNMDPVLAALGWTFAGNGAGIVYTITNPATNVTLKLYYLIAQKKIAIVRYNAV